jgi:DNA-directed RNA polymerase subunit RPC12/RpoP
MGKLLIAVPLLVLAAVVGTNVGWKWILAPLLGWAMIRWAFATLRSMVHDGSAMGAASGEDPTPVAQDERTLYWCEECGTEVLLLVRGSGTPLRHCGTRMHERSEVLN